MRRLNIILLSLAAVFVLLPGAALPVQAEARAEEEQVSDKADLLSSVEENQIAGLVAELELSSSWDVMVVTVAEAGEKSGEELADRWFDENTRSDDGVICMIDMDNREIVIRTFGKAIYYLTDARIEAILNDAFDEISKEDYFMTCSDMLKGVEDAFQRGIPDDQFTYDEETNTIVDNYEEPARLSGGEVLLAVVAALAAGGITVAVICGRYRLRWDKGYQYSARENGSLRLTKNNDTFVNQTVTHRRIPKQNTGGNASGGARSRSHSGSRSTTRMSAGGRRSGGGSRKF